MSVVVDSVRGLVYFDAVSGENPSTGYSFGVINASTHDVIKVLPLDVDSGPMVLDEETGDVYVAGQTNMTMVVYDPASQTFVRQINIGKPVLSMVYDRFASQDLFFTSGYQVFALNPQTGEVVGNVTLANNVDGIVLDSSNGRLYVGQYPKGGISVLEAASLAPVGTIGLPGCCALQFALDDRTQMLYAVTGTNDVYVVNTDTDSFVKSLMVAQSGQNSTNVIAVDNVTGRVYVASSPGGSVLELDAAGDVVQRYRVQSQVAGLAIDTKTQELYATNYHQLTVFDVAMNGTYLVPALIGGAVVVVAVAAVFVYLLVGHKKRERKEVQSGWTGSSRPK
jgi:DNA-binding beta-propeller fold protein YncE